VSETNAWGTPPAPTRLDPVRALALRMAVQRLAGLQGYSTWDVVRDAGIFEGYLRGDES
jgi:hypothetical protein